MPIQYSFKPIIVFPPVCFSDLCAKQNKMEFNSVINRHNDDHKEDVEIVSDPDVLVAKGTAMGVLFLATLIIGLIPFALAYWFKWNSAKHGKFSSTIISVLLGFGGGVLLATTFLHLLPGVREQITQLQSSGQLFETEFAFAELLTCIGFFTIYFISELVHTYITKYNKTSTNAQQAFTRGHSVRGSIMIKKPPTTDTVTGGAIIINDIENNKQECNQIMPNHHSHMHLPSAESATDDFVTSSLRGLLIVLALSVHELFEGMALGLEDTPDHVWLFFAAISSHKFVLAFCVGVELLVSKTNKKLAFCYIFIFAVVSPIGVGIGMIVSQSTGSLIVSGILQGLATGTLIYVVFFEILKKSGSGLLQFAAVIIGFFIMFGLQQISEYIISIFKLFIMSRAMELHLLSK